MRLAALHPAALLRTVSALAVLLAAFSTNAQVVPAPPKLGLCASCHGAGGIATDKRIPNLAGQNLDYLRNAVAQYQSGARDVAAMRAASAMLSAAELDGVLQWYAAQVPERTP